MFRIALIALAVAAACSAALAQSRPDPYGGPYMPSPPLYGGPSVGGAWADRDPGRPIYFPPPPPLPQPPQIRSYVPERPSYSAPSSSAGCSSIPGVRCY